MIFFNVSKHYHKTVIERKKYCCSLHYKYQQTCIHTNKFNDKNTLELDTMIAHCPTVVYRSYKWQYCCTTQGL